ncbi:unnamed protein product [Gongylonema pulchrum]|uniref:TTKRSYEDQ domain-containing protein n=1 Tax=Gongylonema pulchrum TaxID=637853 RepID=A0A183EHD0_9BILA|nr:unnamed protein product [Gongylonema pulchrum]
MKLTKQEKEKLLLDLNSANAIASALKDDLETTRKSYETQLQNLHEHIADLNIKLEEQSTALQSFKSVFNGVSSTKSVSSNVIRIFRP